MWIGTEQGGVDKFDGKYITNFNKDNSILHNQVVSVLEDKRGDIWFGVSFSGFCRYDADERDSLKRFIQLTRKQNLIGNWQKNHYRILNGSGVNFMIEDSEGKMWLSGGGALHLLLIPDNGDLNKMVVNAFTTQDGKSEDNSVFNSDLITKNNRFYWGQGNSLSYIDLNKFKPPSNIPALQITGIDLEQTHIDFRKLSVNIKEGIECNIGPDKGINLNKVKFSGLLPKSNLPIDLQLPYFLNQLTLHYCAVDWDAPHKLHYQYKLEGSDRNWRNITDETSVTYTNLKHGKYIFKVKAIGAGKLWSEEIEYAFYINPPWWYTWWAYTLYSFIFLALLYSWRRYDLKRQRLKLDLETEQVQSEKLAELDKMKSRFFANISHEFRTPLTLILGPLQNIRSKINDIQIKKDMDIMDRNARRLQTLINQLLNLSKLESGKMKLRAHEENLVSLVRLFIQSFESYAAQRNIQLEFNSEKNEILAFVDREKIEKILNNLLSNAFKFTGEGGRIEVVITPLPAPLKGGDSVHSLTMGPAGGKSPLEGGFRGVEIKVSDTGSGIPHEKLPHIFERFYQADDSYSKDLEGSGIGLALTKELVDVHYGDIKVDSVIGKGTTFTIILPLGKSHLEQDEIVEVRKTVDSGTFPDIPDSVVHEDEQKIPGKATDTELMDNSIPVILIVEDNADLRAYIRSFLDSDYQVIEAEDGQIGIDKATETVPDLIISDVMMPKMDGYQLCDKIKSDVRTSHIPVILLTARASLESKLEGLETGADDFITKPFDHQELIIRTKNLIEQRNKLKELFSKGSKPEGYTQIPAMPGIEQKFLDKTSKTVENNMSDPEFSVENFAKEMAMSRVQLHRKLRALIGQAPSEFIRTLRLNKAAELLMQNKGNVSEIAYDVGFNNPTYFSSCFSKQFGLPPKEFLNRNNPGI